MVTFLHMISIVYYVYLFKPKNYMLSLVGQAPRGPAYIHFKHYRLVFVIDCTLDKCLVRYPLRFHD